MRAFSLVELLIVLLIIAIVSVVSLPQQSSVDVSKLDVVTAQVAAALRFSRSEAMRTGLAHGVLVDHNDSSAIGKDLTVYQVNTSTNPFSVSRILNNPLTKQPYDIEVASLGGKSEFSIISQSPVFRFDKVGDSQHVHFDRQGRPVYYQGGVALRLLDAKIEIGNETHQRSIAVSPISGVITLN